MKRYFSFSVSFLTILLAVLFLQPSAAHASSGPVGLNELRTESGSGVGEVTLMWRRYNINVTGYSIVYGTKSGQYNYGAWDIGNIVTYTVSSLVPGKRYCFLLYPHLDGQISSPNSPEVCETAAVSTNIVKGTAGPYGRNLLSAVKGSSSGQIILNWKRYFTDTQSYSIVYGTKPGVYLYGVADAKDASTPGDNDFTFMVGALNPGQRYYFALIPVVNGNALYVTAEVSQVAR